MGPHAEECTVIWHYTEDEVSFQFKIFNKILQKRKNYYVYVFLYFHEIYSKFIFRELDPDLHHHLTDLVKKAARSLDKSRMIRFDETTMLLSATDLGTSHQKTFIQLQVILHRGLKVWRVSETSRLKK